MKKLKDKLIRALGALKAIPLKLRRPLSALAKRLAALKTKLFAVLLAALFVFSAAWIFVSGTRSSAGGFTVWAAAEEETLVRALIDEFLAANPDVTTPITFKVQSNNMVLSEMEKDADAAADLILIASDQVGTLAEQGFISKIGGSFETSVIQNSDPAAVKLASYRPDGASADELYGFPVSLDTCFMYYNKSIINEQAKNLDKLLSVESLKTVAAQGLEDAFGFDIGDGFYSAIPFLTAGATLFGADGTDKTQCDFYTSEQGLAAARYMFDNFTNGSAALFKSDKANNLASLLNSNKLLATVSGSWEWNNSFARYADKIGMAPLPSITLDIGGAEQKRQMVSFINAKIYAVNSRSRDAALAARLADFMTGEKNAIRWFRERRYYAANRAAQADAEFMSDPMIRVMRSQFNSAVAAPSIKQMSKFWDPMGRFGQAVYSGTAKTWEQAKNELRLSVDKILTE
ncbi:MAG: extracellular solute-binding protein [Clostridiales bacterium]|jgi:maltose-binding protein MalE|nr:extracellular solute-binding protein [Clostridiales bacterium]